MPRGKQTQPNHISSVDFETLELSKENVRPIRRGNLFIIYL